MVTCCVSLALSTHLTPCSVCSLWTFLHRTSWTGERRTSSRSGGSERYTGTSLDHWGTLGVRDTVVEALSIEGGYATIHFVAVQKTLWILWVIQPYSEQSGHLLELVPDLFRWSSNCLKGWDIWVRQSAFVEMARSSQCESGKIL